LHCSLEERLAPDSGPGQIRQEDLGHRELEHSVHSVDQGVGSHLEHRVEETGSSVGNPQAEGMEDWEVEHH